MEGRRTMISTLLPLPLNDSVETVDAWDFWAEVEVVSAAVEEEGVAVMRYVAIVRPDESDSVICIFESLAVEWEWTPAFEMCDDDFKLLN